MRNYGFATYDPATQRQEGIVNSKFPIFGPKYNDIKRAFRTIHITDTYQQPFVASPNVSLPPRSTSQSYQESPSDSDAARGVNRVLVATIPHGYKKRPLGYATISGTIVHNVRSRWTYTNAVDYSGQWAPSATLTNADTKSVPVLSAADGYLSPTTYWGDFGPFYFNRFSVPYPSNVYYYLKNPYGLNITPDLTVVTPYTVEIDDTNVYIYRNTYWCDKYGRFAYWYSYYNRWDSDVYARSQGAVDWQGSSFDLTLYLCPYSMEDLL